MCSLAYIRHPFIDRVHTQSEGYWSFKRRSQTPTLQLKLTSINNYEASDHSHFLGDWKFCLHLSSIPWIPPEHPMYANVNHIPILCSCCWIRISDHPLSLHDNMIWLLTCGKSITIQFCYKLQLKIQVRVHRIAMATINKWSQVLLKEVKINFTVQNEFTP